MEIKYLNVQNIYKHKDSKGNWFVYNQKTKIEALKHNIKKELNRVQLLK
jgi:hypothetical protein